MDHVPTPEISLESAFQAVIEAQTQSEKSHALKKVSRKFYFMCRHAGMKREDILSLATEIIDCFSEDIKALKINVDRKK
ncbi:MAG: hypothetical protein RDV48_16500 [Candidatus Eremiobacteraeota bacterium]|nr:hypothetical protein [Candidatus Eremiobacteraeota bacterium]